ncbi:MAG: recombinase RecA [Candidatus Theseobacter exili]|nr:recombinase RecA [Candidatus Theseobacter exili]
MTESTSIKQNNIEDKKTSGKEKVLEVAMMQIEKQFGQGSIMLLGKDSTGRDIPAISTGALTLDIALGIGGVPRGRVVEVFGPESSGKTTLALQIAANAQRAGGVAAFIDAEHALDPDFAKTIGLDLDNLLVSQPDCGEDALNIAEVLVRSNAIDIIVIDSVAALVPRAEIEGDIGDSFIGTQARLMSQALRKLTSAIAKSKTCVLFINQIREKIGVMFGSPETTPGGRALKFYSSVRIDIRRIGSLKDNQGVVYGNRVRAKVVKNKVAPPFRDGEFDLLFAEGISREGSILDVGINCGIIEKRGSWLSYGAERLGQGKEMARDLLKKSPELQAKIVKEIKEKLDLK